MYLWRKSPGAMTYEVVSETTARGVVTTALCVAGLASEAAARQTSATFNYMSTSSAQDVATQKEKV